MVLIYLLPMFFDTIFYNIDQINAFIERAFQKMKVQFIGIDVQKRKRGNVVVLGEPVITYLLFQTLQRLPKLWCIFYEEKRLQQIVVPF